MDEPRYLPIEERGVSGDLRTVALVGTDGTIDWCCPSRFDAPSLFASLLDSRRGGSFRLACRTATGRKQLHLPDTNVLLTHSLAAEAVGEVVDFTVPETSERAVSRDLLVRCARAVRGRATFNLVCRPPVDYGRARYEVHLVDGVGAVFTSGGGRCVLRTAVPLEVTDDGGVRATSWTPARWPTWCWSGAATCGPWSRGSARPCRSAPPSAGRGGRRARATGAAGGRWWAAPRWR